jgi:IMP cyclohydrolase
MVTENQIDTAEFLLNQDEIGGGDGGFKIISTYTGEDDKNPTAPFWQNSLEDVVTTIHLKGNTAKELVAAMYNNLDEEFRVSAAAAVWTGKKWDLAVKNLHEQQLQLGGGLEQ